MIVSEKLIKRIKEGNRKAQLELYRLSFNLLMSVVIRYKNNEEDQMSLVNNTFVKIINKIDTFKPDSSYHSWIKRIVTNEVIDDFRKHKKYQALFDFEKDIALHDPLSIGDIEYDIEVEALEEMLYRLPKATRLVFNLYAIDGFSNKEIGEQLGIKYETAKWHIKEARKRLKAMLQKEQESRE